MKRVLVAESIYEKCLSHLKIVCLWFDLDWETWDFWDYLINVKNDNVAKKIAFLCTVDSDIACEDECEHVERLSWVFDWVFESYIQVKNQKAIGEFTFGIVRKFNSKERGHAFDVKKINDKSDVKKYEKIWSKILFTDEPITWTQLWLDKFDEISDDIPRK